MRFVSSAVVIACALATAPLPVRAEEQGEAPVPTVDTDVPEAGEADAAYPPRTLGWNEFDWSWTTFRFGAGFLTDFAAYGQDAESKQQFALEQDVALRDLRVLFRGRFKTKRPFSWTIGYMYDAGLDEWHFRQTGVQIGFPELHGRVFIGRTKEGYSLNKVMVGYHGWMNERNPANDAFVPILADGIKWMGDFPKSGIFYSLGLFGDELSEDEKFATADHQIVTRIGWRPLLSEKDGEVLHLAVMGRYFKPDEGSIQVRARPENYLAPYFLDTGKFAADRGLTVGGEAYYRQNSWLVGGEYHRHTIDATSGEEPLFHGGDVAVAWIMTGETRAYNGPGGYFEAVSPARPVFKKGPGAWEAVLHYSYADFDSGSIQGGKFWRITPMINWHMSDSLRLEFGYGYGELDRFNVTGHTHFFQARVQMTL